MAKENGLVHSGGASMEKMGQDLDRWWCQGSFGMFRISLGGGEVSWLVMETKAEGQGL